MDAVSVASDLRRATFSANEGTAFTFRLGSERTVAMKLNKVSDARRGANQEQFSIFFLGPLELFLQQALYQVSHSTMGSFALFIVPIAKENNGFLYEAVFNIITYK